ncbi:PHP domain-containing protein [Paenibacillus sp. FSL R7-0331]|uniref:PHP domain-containing protein n=1 Tax=Paenibacillus sp. FSL R7-0331 TaxID=1536773 RepID=UPI0004F7465D|nr:PHP domain-containing protein [Paenibacillus sp. FSL R7-0331]AIQ53386.1 histidinol phosphatase [Paenibacillus sp. FSL R7-0331]
MKIDLHTHGKLSKKSAFSEDYFRDMVKEALANGLQALALTEHFNTSNFFGMYETLDRMYPYNGHYYEADGLRIFPGMEVDIAETGHILLIGLKEDILEARYALEGHTGEDSFIPFRQLLELADARGLWKIGAHPFRTSTPLHHLEPSLLSRLDAFDFNAKDIYMQGEQPYRALIEPFAARLGIPVIAGSDSHQCLQYGSVVNRLEQDCSTVAELKSAVQQGRYTIEVSPCLATKVKGSVMMKKLLKQMAGEAPSRDEAAAEYTA